MINSVHNKVSLLDGFDSKLDSIDENKKQDKSSFTSILQENIAQVNDLQLDADQKAQDFALGKIDSIHEVTIATQKAELALNLTLAVQNKVISAYEEIMRMQV